MIGLNNIKRNKMSKKQTAIDWLIQALESDIEVDESNMVTIKMHEHDYLTSKVIAKEMEKEQIIDACIYGPFEDLAEDFYNKTYG
jgi:hypothetical protein